MSAKINQEYYNFIQSLISERTQILKGFDKPDYYFLEMLVLFDETNKQVYSRPQVVLRFGDNYIDDRYLSILIFPDLTSISYLGE